MIVMLSLAQLIQRLKERQGKRTQAEFAKELGCSPAYLSDVYAGNRNPGPMILKALGLKLRVSYEDKTYEEKH